MEHARAVFGLYVRTLMNLRHIHDRKALDDIIDLSMAHWRYLVLLRANLDLPYLPFYISRYGKAGMWHGSSACMRKNTEHRLGRKHWYLELGRMAYGISRAMIPPLHTSCWLRVLVFRTFLFHTRWRSWAVLIYRGGLIDQCRLRAYSRLVGS